MIDKPFSFFTRFPDVVHCTLIFDPFSLIVTEGSSPLQVTLPEWLTGSPAIQVACSGWALPASVRIAQVTNFFRNRFLFSHLSQSFSNNWKRAASKPQFIYFRPTYNAPISTPISFATYIGRNATWRQYHIITSQILRLPIPQKDSQCQPAETDTTSSPRENPRDSTGSFDKSVSSRRRQLMNPDNYVWL
jgi:hypothetical protein